MINDVTEMFIQGMCAKKKSQLCFTRCCTCVYFLQDVNKKEQQKTISDEIGEKAGRIRDIRVGRCVVVFLFPVKWQEEML